MAVNTDFEVHSKIAQIRMELISAAQILKGPHLEEFKSVIAEVANLVGLGITDTGTFTRVDPI